MKNHKAVHKIILQQNPLKDKINLSQSVPLSWATSLHRVGSVTPGEGTVPHGLVFHVEKRNKKGWFWEVSESGVSSVISEALHMFEKQFAAPSVLNF